MIISSRRWRRVLFLILGIAALALLLAGCRATRAPAPTPTPTATPFVVPTPPPTAAQVGLGPAPITSLDVVHQPFGDGACGACHDLNGKDPRKLWGDVQTVCRECHWQEVPDPNIPVAYPHEPFTKGNCLDCHVPHASANPKLLVEPVTQLCHECHQDQALRQPHPSVAEGECNLCHLAHGSEQPAILRQSQAQLCGACHTDQVDPAKTFAGHAQAENIQCSQCHQPHDPTSKPATVNRELCASCHDNLPKPASFKFPHTPYAQGRCADCHPSFHKNPDAPLLAPTQAEFCNKCHEDHGQVVNQPHPNVAKGECRLCHDGHGSNFPAHLVKAEDEICRTCHKEQFDPKTTFAKHQADKLPACTACHSPHEPTTSGPPVAIACGTCHKDVLAKGSAHTPVKEGKCQQCHPQFHGQQPDQLAAVNKNCTDCHQPETGPVKHPPYQEGKCTSCHVPHSSPHTALLNKAPSQLCGACHPRQTATFGASAHATRVSAQCTACHQAHNGQIDNLLHARTNALCDSCHKGLPHGFHPVSGGQDPVRGGELSCISCHTPHGSTHPADLRASGDALCLICHKFDQAPAAMR